MPHGAYRLWVSVFIWKKKSVSLVWDRGFAFLKTFLMILMTCGTPVLIVKSTGVGQDEPGF